MVMLLSVSTEIFVKNLQKTNHTLNYEAIKAVIDSFFCENLRKKWQTGINGIPCNNHDNRSIDDLVYGGINASLALNTLRPRQNGHHVADEILKCNFLNENVWILIEISLKFVPKGQIDNIPALD